jgi:dTMP kinase
LFAGKFITFEGIDGSGKSTQIRLLASALRERGLDPITTQEPGGTPLGRGLRELLLTREEVVHPRAELLLFAADRAQHIELLIKPALNDGRIVISDRFADATLAYQSAGRNLSETSVKSIIKFATGGLKPDLTFLLDTTVESALMRLKTRREESTDTFSNENRMDLETSDFYSRVRQKYLEIAEKEPGRCVVISADNDVYEIHHEILKITLDRLQNTN